MKTINYSELTPELIESLDITVWGEEDTERLHCSEIDEAIEYALDWMRPTPFAEVDSITVVGYKRQELGENEPDPEDLLDQILDGLDDEYGDPDGSPGGLDGPTDAMMAAAKELCDVVRKDYTPWTCEGVLRVELDGGAVMSWVKENRPYWLEDRK